MYLLYAKSYIKRFTQKKRKKNLILKDLKLDTISLHT